MKIQLSRFFEKTETPLKTYMGKNKQERKDSNRRRLSMNSSQLKNSYEVIDPLNQQLEEYRERLEKVKTSHCRAYEKMKNYMNEQQIKLKHIRLEEPKENNRMNTPQVQQVSKTFSNEELKTNIPSVDDLFKNQRRDTIVYQNGLLNNLLENRVVSIDNTVKSLKLKYTSERRSVYVRDNQPQIDRTIAFHKQKNKKILNKLLKQKSEMMGGIDMMKHKNLQEQMTSANLQPTKKKKIRLSGLKTVTIQSCNQTRSVSPSIALLFEIKNLSQTRLKKDMELDVILKSEHHNRPRNLDDKAHYYSDSIQLKRINASTMFKTRKIMNEKLMHRLKVSRDQGKNFSEYMLALKQQRVMICDSLQNIFERIRLALVAGKILREKDLDAILREYEADKELQLPQNASIVSKIKDIMI